MDRDRGVASPLVGRTAELERIKAVIESARIGRSAALLVEGEAGVGKSTLLAAASRLAAGFTRLTGRGIEAEATLHHAALLGLLSPVQNVLADLPPRQRDALAGALGWGPAPGSGDRFLVSAGAMTMLALAAERRPILVVVDDVQWLDTDSAQAILFAARRLTADSVAFVFAARTGEVLPFAVEGIERLTVEGLSTEEAAELLDPRVSSRVAARLHAVTGGNPLAMLEAASMLSAEQRAGAAPLPDPVVVGGRLDDVFARRLAELPAPAWKAAVLLAASRNEDSGAVSAALRAEGLDPDVALEEAANHGLLSSADATGARRFRHPLLRAAVWQHARDGDRRDAHRALAAVLPATGEERVWHLSLATTEPDGALATELAKAAAAMRSRRGFAAASVAFERAAAQTPDRAAAAEWLAAAMDDSFIAGDVGRTRRLGDRLVAEHAGSSHRAGPLHTLGLLEEQTGSIPMAARLQREAAAAGTGLLRVRALAHLAMLYYRLDDPTGMLDTAAELGTVADPNDPEQRMLALYSEGAANVFGGDLNVGHAQMREALALLESDPRLRDDPRYLLHALVAGRWLSDLSVVLPFVDRRMHRARELGALGALVPALALVAAGRSLMGDHAGAYADAAEAVELGEILGFTSEPALAYAILAFEADARGRTDEADAALRTARSLTDRAGTTGVADHLLLVEALSAELRGQPNRVVELLEPRLTAGPAGRSGRGSDQLSVAPPLVEAYLAVGRTSDAGDLANRYAAANPTPRTAQAEATVQRCLGLVEADDAVAAAHFERALTAYHEAGDPFEAARTALVCGSRLRRAGQRVAAREQLRAARDAFTGMDLPLWAGRAADELSATGERVRQRGSGTAEALTAQEIRVARLVAQGLTNREVAASLFLSPKTVEHHLARVFRKRGFRTRAELAHAFAQES